jgi:predicted nucleic acid-binding protein
MTASNKVVIDTSVLVALVDGRDKWHESAKTLRDAFKAQGVGLVYFDSVVNETFGVLARRASEQKRSHEFSGLLETLTKLVSKETITWISFQTKRFYDQVVSLIRDTSDELNFHDALIALNCRLFKIRAIAH